MEYEQMTTESKKLVKMFELLAREVGPRVTSSTIIENLANGMLFRKTRRGYECVYFVDETMTFELIRLHIAPFHNGKLFTCKMKPYKNLLPLIVDMNFHIWDMTYISSEKVLRILEETKEV